MKNLSRVLFVLLSMLIAVPMIMAQEDATVVFTEDDINATYRVTNPRRATMSNVFVDLKPGLVEISATYTPRRGGEFFPFVAQYSPSAITVGTVEWTLVDLYRTDGGEFSETVQTLIENRIGNAWTSYWAGRIYRFDIVSVTVTDTDITYGYVYTGERPPVEPTIEYSDDTLQVTYTESEVNEAYRVTNPRRATITDVYVDLQPGQVSISAVYTPRRGDAMDTVTVLVPQVVDNVLSWTVVSVTADGQLVDDLSVVDDLISNSWIAYWRQRFARQRIQDVTITDDAITYSYQ